MNKMIKQTSILFSLLSFMLMALTPAQAAYQAQTTFVPAGTPITANIQSTLSSEFTRIGETFTATLNSPIYAGSQIVAAPGSTLQGQVVGVEKAGRGGKPGSVDIRLTSVITPNGQRYPLSASVNQQAFELSASGGRTSHFAKATAGGAATGALSGLIGGAISGGSKGKGAAIGTGIGAGVGILGGAFKRGKQFVLQSGTSVPFTLDQAMQVNTGAAPVRQLQPPEYGTVPSQPAPAQGGGFADPGASQNHGYNPYY